MIYTRIGDSGGYGILDLCAWLNGHAGEWLAFDLETTGLEDTRPDSRIVSAAFACDEEALVVPFSHPEASWSDVWVKAATRVFECVNSQLIAQFGKFDARWVRRHTGVNLAPMLRWDTKDASFTLDENKPSGLKQRAVEDLGIEPWDEEIEWGDNGAEGIEWDTLAEYNAGDARYTYDLAMWQRQEFAKKRTLGRVFWKIAMPAVRALAEVEHRGMLLDTAEAEDRLHDAREQQSEIASKIAETVPDWMIDEFGEEQKYAPSLAPTSNFFRAYAENHWPVLKKTDKGNPSWAKSVLVRLVERGYDNAGLVLDYRKLDKQITTYLTRWPDDIDDQNRIYTTYRTTTAKTGRLSSVNPNLQQVDRTLKTCFVAPEGHAFVQADWSQIEVRLMAMIAEDPELLAVYHRGDDVYIHTAAAVMDIDLDDVTKEDRQAAKAIVLGFLYGMQAKAFTSYAFDVFGVKVSLEEAKAFRQAFFSTYSRVREYHILQRNRVRKDEAVRDLFGRQRRLPEISTGDLLQRWQAERRAINFPIQGSAAGLMLLALAKIVEAGLPVVGTVHDSLLLEVPRGDLETDLDTLGRIMTTPAELWEGLELTVPLAAEFEIGPRWGDPQRVVTITGDVETRDKVAA